MFKKIMIMIMMVSTLSAISADTLANAGFDKLTKQEQIDILKTVADKTAASKISKKDTIKNVSEWVNLGSSIGKGLSSSAKELGVTVNEFSKTSVGKWTMFLIIFKVIGSHILHFIAGMLMLIIGIPITTFLINKKVGVEITYNEKDGKKLKVVKNRLDDETTGIFWFAYIVIVLASIITMLTGN